MSKDNITKRRQDRRPSPRCPRCGIPIHTTATVAWEGSKKVKVGQAYWLAEHIRWHDA